MLMLSRKTGERIAIGDAVVVTVLRSSCGRVKLGITAPDDVSVLRTEIDECAETAQHSHFAPARLAVDLNRPGRLCG